MTVGILAIQGNKEEHIKVLSSLGAECRPVKTVNDLIDLSHLLIPGGESTVMSQGLQREGLDQEIVSRVRDGSLAVFGTCAGAILLAKECEGVSTLGLIDMQIDRNAYGTQHDSFDASVRVKNIDADIKARFIRAPRITSAGKDVDVLAGQNSDPVLVQSGRVLAATFHPELVGETRVHEMFLEM